MLGNMWTGVIIAGAASVALAGTHYAAYSSGYDVAETKIEGELATSTQDALLAANTEWEARLAEETARALEAEQENIRLQQSLAQSRRSAASDLRTVLEGLPHATSSADVCQLGPAWIRLHNTAAGYPDLVRNTPSD